MAGAIEGDIFIGRKAQELKGLLKINYPIEHGVVDDWDDMERIWNYIYQSELETASEEVLTFFLFLLTHLHPDLRFGFQFYSINHTVLFDANLLLHFLTG
jgi:hypothetical protein